MNDLAVAYTPLTFGYALPNRYGLAGMNFATQTLTAPPPTTVRVHGTGGSIVPLQRQRRHTMAEVAAPAVVKQIKRVSAMEGQSGRSKSCSSCGQAQLWCTCDGRRRCADDDDGVVDDDSAGEVHRERENIRAEANAPNADISPTFSVRQLKAMLRAGTLDDDTILTIVGSNITREHDTDSSAKMEHLSAPKVSFMEPASRTSPAPTSLHAARTIIPKSPSMVFDVPTEAPPTLSL
jgi:hypothetical protein